jgi:hypothetical protein
MAMNEGWGPAGGGGLFQVLGIIYLSKAIRRRREQRRLRKANGSADTQQFRSTRPASRSRSSEKFE